MQPCRVINFKASPVIVSVPHAGRLYHTSLATEPAADRATLRIGEDPWMDHAAMGAAHLGIPVVMQRIPRAYLDTNRRPDEMDPKHLSDQVLDFQTTFKAKSGLGVVPTAWGDHCSLYAVTLNSSEIKRRVNDFHLPFHQCLSKLITTSLNYYPKIILLDLHSMPQLTTSLSRPPRLVLGDRYGQSCAGSLSNFVRQQADFAGLSTTMNHPFAGGYTVQYHSDVAKGVSALQLEFCRSLYLSSEHSFEKGPGFAPLKGFFTDLCQRLLAQLKPDSQVMAAE